MSTARHFLPALYALLLLGVTGYGLGTGSAGLWLIGAVGIGLNALLVRRRLFRPMPRIVANLITLAAGLWIGSRIYGGELPVEPVGDFLVLLQLIKLYEQRGNRDYGQLIVLSLLTMVASAIAGGGASLLFAGVFLAWVLLSLYTCLLFHLKVSGDNADAPQHPATDRRLGSSLRRLTTAITLAACLCAAIVFVFFPRGAGSRFFNRSGFDASQAVTGFSGSVGFQDIARIQQNTDPVAYVELLRNGQPVRQVEPIYLRGNTLDVYDSDPASPKRWVWSQSPTLGGSVNRFDPIAENNLIVPVQYLTGNAGVLGAMVEQRVELEPTGSDTLFLLPGLVALRLDRGDEIDRSIMFNRVDSNARLHGRPATQRLRYVAWSTDQIPLGFTRPIPMDLNAVEERGETINAANPPLSPELYGQHPFPQEYLGVLRDRTEAMRLMTAALAAGGPAGEEVRTLRTAQPEELARWMQNRVGVTMQGMRLQPFASYPRQLVQRAAEMAQDAPPRPPSDELLAFVLDPDVTGRDIDGQPLIAARLATAGPTVADEQIARAIEMHLRTRYGYSLDLSEAVADLPPTRDPLAWFVSEDGRRGHCEFFAGTMALACQSVGIPARVVVGFKSSEFNGNIGRYTVRQSDAHAWVEVLTRRGWLRFDPTSGTDVDAQRHGSGGVLDAVSRTLRQLFESLEYAWVRNVVAYDRSRQQTVNDSFVQELDRSMGERNGDGTGEVRSTLERLLGPVGSAIGGLWRWLRDTVNVPGVVATVVAGLIVALPLAAVGLVVAFLAGKWRLRRRARRIGLDDLPPRERRRLARELGFYAGMVDALHRRGHRRRVGQTPLEFAHSLDVLSPDAFDAVQELTAAFYRVRYGRESLTDTARRHLRGLARRLRNLA